MNPPASASVSAAAAATDEVTKKAHAAWDTEEGVGIARSAARCDSCMRLLYSAKNVLRIALISYFEVWFVSQNADEVRKRSTGGALMRVGDCARRDHQPLMLLPFLDNLT